MGREGWAECGTPEPRSLLLMCGHYQWKVPPTPGIGGFVCECLPRAGRGCVPIGGSGVFYESNVTEIVSLSGNLCQGPRHQVAK